jgi:hypothetical protein
MRSVRLCPDRRSDGAHSPSAGELRRDVLQLGAKPIGSCKALEWTRTSYSDVILKLVEVGAPRRERRLFDRGHHLSGYPGKGLNFSFQGCRLGREAPMLEGVPVALGSAATGTVHSADARPPHRSRQFLLNKPFALVSRIPSRPP